MLAVKQSLEFAFVSVANQNSKKNRRFLHYLIVAAARIAN